MKIFDNIVNKLVDRKKEELRKRDEESKRQTLKKLMLLRNAKKNIDRQTNTMSNKYCPVYKDYCPALEEECSFFTPGRITHYMEPGEYCSGGWICDRPGCSLGDR